MDILSQLKIGDKLNIERYQGDSTLKENNILSSQIIDLRGKYLHISTPVYKGKKYFLHEGQKISIFFYRDEGAYQFYAEVIEQTKANITTFIIKPIGEIQRIQRRNYYRLPVVKNVVLEKQHNDKLLKLQCVSKDLSGGGIKVICNDELEQGENVKIDLYLYENQSITIDGEVVRTIIDSDSGGYEVGIRFKEINQTNEDKIFAFIFEKQRLLRKKGLI